MTDCDLFAIEVSRVVREFNLLPFDVVVMSRLARIFGQAHDRHVAHPTESSKGDVEQARRELREYARKLGCKVSIHAGRPSLAKGGIVLPIPNRP